MKKSDSKQAHYRSVVCPTCHAAVGAYCKSIGIRGHSAGNIMGTSCHNARLVLSGDSPRSTRTNAKATKAKGWDRSATAKRAWATRRTNAQLKAAAARHQEVTGPAHNIDITKLIQTAIDILEAGATNVKLELDGVGKVGAERADLPAKLDGYKYQLMIG